MNYLFMLMLIILVEIGLAAGIAFVFIRIWKKDNRLRRFAQNLALLLFTPLFILTILEVFFGLFFIQPDGINFTLASQGWSERYWNPINSLGYRDYEWDAADLLDRKTVIVTGDSFVAGWGIANVEDRFSNKLGKLLGKDYAVITVAQTGWGLPDELNALKTYPHHPEVVVLSHYIIDIEPSGGAVGIGRPKIELLPPSSKWQKALVDNSHVANYVYWRLLRWQAYGDLLKRLDVQTYQSYLRDLFENPEVWRVHTEVLQSIYTWSEEQGHALIVVVFPDMLRVDETRDLGDKVIKFYEDIQVPVVDVAELIEDMPAHARVVNSVDTHASVEVHALVADALRPIVLGVDE